MKLLVRITKAGKLEPHDMGAWAQMVQKHKGHGDVVLEVSRLSDRRSPQANRRYWGVIVPVVRELLNRGREVPLSKESVHFVLVQAFAGADVIDPKLVPGGPPAPVPTRSMTTAQFHDLGEQVQIYYEREHGLVFPDMEIDVPTEG